MLPIHLKLLPSGRARELLAQGWTLQTTIGEPRLSEIVENYRQLGYEVLVLEHPEEPDPQACNVCFSAGTCASAAKSQTVGDVYVRGCGDGSPLEDL